MVTQAEVRRFNRAQNQVITAASGDLGRLFNSLDLGSPERARDALLEAYPAIAGQYSDLSSTVAAEWYEDLRRSQRGGQYAALLAAPPLADHTTRTVRWAAGVLFTPEPWKAQNLLDGSMTRMLGDAARDTISENVRRDPQAAGWQRLTQPDACQFCRMLHSRGGVYKRKTADFASHDNCRCTAAPTWDASLPEVDVKAYEASERMGSVRRRASDPNLSAKDRAKAQSVIDRHRASTRAWIEANA